MMKRILAALCLTALLLTSAALAENVTVEKDGTCRFGAYGFIVQEF